LVAGSNPVSRSSLPREAGRPERKGTRGAGTGRGDGEEAEKEAMPRDLISLACGECKRRNYTTTKNKKTHQEKLEMAKYCRFCRKHTAHKEGKV
jgi:large subunit ribosomal protein L33